MAGGIIFLKPIQIDNNWKMTYTLQWNEMAGGSLFKANKNRSTSLFCVTKNGRDTSILLPLCKSPSPINIDSSLIAYSKEYKRWFIEDEKIVIFWSWWKYQY